jgi:hypothetical protein
MKALTAVAICMLLSLMDASAATLRYHTLVLDSQNMILPWYTPAENAYDQYLDQLWIWLPKAPNVSGLPMYYLYCGFKPGSPITPDNWENDWGEKIPNFVDFSLRYYAYAGDRRPIDISQGMVDYSLAHGITPASYAWPNFPYGTANAGATTINGDNVAWNTDDVLIDLGSDMGMSYYKMYLFTGDSAYRDAAINVADTLASKIQPGSATSSPWPYVVNARTGATRSRYTSNFAGALTLFDLLIENSEPNSAAYASARQTLRTWILQYPMKNGLWVDGHSDVFIDGTDDLSNTCKSNMNLYLMDNPSFDPDFMTDVPKLLKWTEDNFVNVDTPDGLPGIYYGAYVPAEQIAYMYRMGYQTARQAGEYASWYAVTGDETFKDRAYRGFNYNTYMMKSTGEASDGPTDNVGWWWGDTYAEGPRMYFYGLKAVPEWAPSKENHILFSDAVIRDVTFGSSSVTYTATQSGRDYLRTAFRPTGVTLNSRSLTQTINPDIEGYLIMDLGNGDYSLVINRQENGQVSLSAGNACSGVCCSSGQVCSGQLVTGTECTCCTGTCHAPNLVVNSAIVYQTMNGIGSNINTWSWKGGELRPALDALIDTLGHSMFRVVHDRMEWAGIGSTRPAATLTGLQNLDPATLQAVYETPDMQDLWDTVAYLNSKGVKGDQVLVNFMGWTAPWMGGSGAYGTASSITNNAQTNQDIATMLASLVYYGHHRRDISGQNQNLDFSYVAPFNEIDLNGLEGPLVSASQLNIIYGNIVNTLNAMGDTTTKLSGPDTASGPDSYTGAFSTAVKARMAHFSWHSYSGSPASPATSRNGIKGDWMTETSKWCSGCDSNQAPGESEWSFGSDTGDVILGDIDNGFSSVLTWEGFDTYYYHHNSFSAWGHVGCTQNSRGCVTSDAYPRVYSVRGRAWPEAAIAKAVRPGMAMIDTSTTLSSMTALSFSGAGRFSIVGHNEGSQATVYGKLEGIPVGSLSLYQTGSSQALQQVGEIPINDGMFTASIPADAFFYLISTTDTTPPSMPTGLATTTSGSRVDISWNAATDNEAVSQYRIYRCLGSACAPVYISSTTATSYSDAGLAAGTYRYAVAAIDAAGNTGPNSTISVTVDCDTRDTDCSGCIEIGELTAYVSKWLNGQVTIGSLMEAIRLWKTGC